MEGPWLRASIYVRWWQLIIELLVSMRMIWRQIDMSAIDNISEVRLHL
jgi:hypothetical protein